MKMPMNLRVYDFTVTPFAEGEIEYIQIKAKNRAYGFTLAAAQASDPNNVWRIKLMRENGRTLNPASPEEWSVPSEYKSPTNTLYHKCDIPLRVYDVEITLFGGAYFTEGACVAGRVHAFAEALMNSTTPDGAVEVVMKRIGDAPGDAATKMLFIDPSMKYGGITVDLSDPVEGLVRKR